MSSKMNLGDRMGVHYKTAVGLRRYSGDNALDFAGVVHPCRHHVNPHLLGGRFGFAPERNIGGGLRMKEGGGMVNVGRDLLERLQPLAAHRRLEIREACDIAAGPGEARDKAAANGIGDVHEDDRRITCQRPQSRERRIALDEKYIRQMASQLCAVTSHQLGVAIGPTYFNQNVAAIGPAEFAQSSQETSIGGRVLSGRCRTD